MVNKLVFIIFISFFIFMGTYQVEIFMWYMRYFDMGNKYVSHQGNGYIKYIVRKNE